MSYAHSDDSSFVAIPISADVSLAHIVNEVHDLSFRYLAWWPSPLFMIRGFSLRFSYASYARFWIDMVSRSPGLGVTSFESLVAFVPPVFYVLSVSSSSIEWMYSSLRDLVYSPILWITLV